MGGHRRGWCERACRRRSRANRARRRHRPDAVRAAPAVRRRKGVRADCANPPGYAFARMKPDIAIIGAGYVGLPLAQVFADAGRNVVLVDVNEQIVDALGRGESHIEDVPSEQLERHVEAGRIAATTDYDVLRDADAILLPPP